MIDRNFLVHKKNVRKNFLKTMQKIAPENSLPLPRNRQKTDLTSSVITLMTNDHVYYKSNQNLLDKSPNQYTYKFV